MFFVLVVAVAFAVALIRGVPLTVIAGRRFVALWAVFLGAGLHILLNPLVLPPDQARTLLAPPAPGLLPTGSLLYLASLGCALLFLGLNRALPGLKLMLLGLALNTAVIVANGGHMPGDPGQLARAGLLEITRQELAEGRWSPFSIADEGTPLAFLGDVIYTPLPFREPVVLSVGDLVIALGVFGFFNPLTVSARDAKL